MATDETRSNPTPLGTTFGTPLRIDEQWFEALRGELSEETDS